jgi:hypothetical protein
MQVSCGVDTKIPKEKTILRYRQILGETFHELARQRESRIAEEKFHWRKLLGERILRINGRTGRGKHQEIYPGTGSRGPTTGSTGTVQRQLTPTAAFRRLINQPL